MPVNNTTLLQVRLTEAEKRSLKTLAVSQGLTLRQAILQAFDAWAAQLQSPALPADPKRGTRAGADVQMPSQPKRGAARRQDRRQTEGRLSSTPGVGSIPNLGATSRAWLRNAAQLDWSKWPEAERVARKTGNVWVVRGTRAPLDILTSPTAPHCGARLAKLLPGWGSNRRRVSRKAFPQSGAGPACVPHRALAG